MGNLLAGTDWVLRQGDIGRQQGQEKRFNMLAGRALGGDQDAYQEQVSIDPGRAQEVQKAGDVMLRKTRGAAKYMQAALDSGNPLQIEAGWRTVRPFMAREYPDAQISEQWDDSYKSGLQSYLAKTAYLDDPDSGGLPTGYREAHMKAVAAGYQPGTEEYKNAFRVNLGTVGRASSAGFGFDTFEDAQGFKRPQRNNPRTGGTEIWYDEQNRWVPLGGQGGQGAAAAPMPGPQRVGETAVEIDGVSPDAGKRIASVAEAMRVAGFPVDQIDGWVSSQSDASPALMGSAASSPQAVPGLGRGRSPEEEALLVHNAKNKSDLDAYRQGTRDVVEREGQVAGAKAGVAQAAEQVALRRKNSTALSVYSAGREKLMTALAETETGPVAGRIPALTAAQQTAKGAHAAMAPVLKQMFRQAGEGTFTDSDQALLLAMIPDRTDHPPAAEAKMAGIDAIVAAKLGVRSIDDAGGAEQLGDQSPPIATGTDDDLLINKYLSP